MRKLGTSMAFIALTGCTTINYSEFELSDASISNLQVNEIFNLSKKQHKLELSFDYKISEYVEGFDLYSCDVQLQTLDETTTSSHSKRYPCKLDKAEGQITIIWPTILDKTFTPSKKQLSNIKYPIEYFVAIHQQTGRNTSYIIGTSPIQISKVKI
jgi:hypothetical protein